MQYSAGFFIVFEALSREHTQRVCDRGSNEEDDKKDKLDCIGYFVPGPYSAANTALTSTLKPGSKTDVACVPLGNMPCSRYCPLSKCSIVIREFCGSTIQYSGI